LSPGGILRLDLIEIRVHGRAKIHAITACPVRVTDDGEVIAGWFVSTLTLSAGFLLLLQH
jgi:hypothetical protein